jgi:hypothetical protein
MKIFTGIAAIIMILSMSACGTAQEAIEKENIVNNTVQIPVGDTGRSVTCLVYTNAEYEEGGFSCNWEAFNAEDEG